jgi:hypothetical protein
MTCFKRNEGRDERFARWRVDKSAPKCEETNLGLGGGSDTGDGKSDVDSGTNTLEEELGLEEDLSITVAREE